MVFSKYLSEIELRKGEIVAMSVLELRKGVHNIQLVTLFKTGKKRGKELLAI